jgi:hypothetical protein
MVRQIPPRPGWLQLTHGPLHETLQQTPSVQKPDLHSLSFVQTALFGFGPQLPFTHRTFGAQSEFDVQTMAHLFVAGSQLNGAQTVAGPALQWPSPSQTLMSLTEAPSHMPGWHSVPVGCLRHFPWPSQVPSRPQLDAGDAAQSLARPLSPFATKEHVPGAFGPLQVLHVSVQALLQQTPSTQKLL